MRDQNERRGADEVRAEVEEAQGTYEPPRLVAIGSIEELTHGVTETGGDAGAFFASV